MIKKIPPGSGFGGESLPGLQMDIFSLLPPTLFTGVYKRKAVFCLSFPLLDVQEAYWTKAPSLQL